MVLVPQIVAVLVAAPDVPGADTVIRLNNPKLFAHLPGRPEDCLISEDGQTAFVIEGRIQRFGLRKPTCTGEEAVFYHRTSRGGPLSFTTSQGAHLDQYKHLFDKVTSVKQVGNIILAFARNWKSILIASSVDDGSKLRLTALNLNARSAHPNRDWEVASLFGRAAVCLGAKEDGRTIKWYIQRPRRMPPGELFEYRVRDGAAKSTLLGTVPPSSMFQEFDPKAKLLLGAAKADRVPVFKLGAKSVNWIPLPAPRAAAKDSSNSSWPTIVDKVLWPGAFLSRGRVFYRSDRVYRLTSGGKWEKFGDFAFIAKNATGNYWLIVYPRDKSMWLAHFK